MDLLWLLLFQLRYIVTISELQIQLASGNEDIPSGMKVSRLNRT